VGERDIGWHNVRVSENGEEVLKKTAGSRTPDRDPLELKL